MVPQSMQYHDIASRVLFAFSDSQDLFIFSTQSKIRWNKI